MGSFFEKAKRVIKDNEDSLRALEEYDRTRKLRKTKYKGRYNFTLDEDLMIAFRSYCIKHNIKLSNEIEELIKGFLEKVK